MIKYKYVSDPKFIELGSIRLGMPAYYGFIESIRADKDECTTYSKMCGRNLYVPDAAGKSYYVDGVSIVDCKSITIIRANQVERRIAKPPLIYCLCNSKENAYGDPQGSQAIFEVNVDMLFGFARSKS